MPVIEKKKAIKRIAKTYRLREDLVARIEQVAQDMNESRTYIIESLLEYALRAHEQEVQKKKK